MALSIDFSDMDAPQDIMNVFGTMLRDLTNLRALYFNLSSARINRAMFEDFANGLLVQKKLDYLVLDFTAGDLGERELTMILDKLVGNREVRVFTDFGFLNKDEYLVRYRERGLLIYIENNNALANLLLRVPERKVKKHAEWERKARETILEAGGGDPGNDLIPEIAKGHEEEYLSFLKGKLVYKPNRDNDEGRREFRIGVLANPLSGTFDIQGCRDSDKYLSVSTGFRTGKNPANENKLEVWIVPQFVLQKDPRAVAYNDFLQTLDEYRNKPFVVLFNAGGCELLSRHSVSGVGVSESSGLFDMLRVAYDTNGHRLAYDSNNREKLHYHHSCLESFEFLSE